MRIQGNLAMCMINYTKRLNWEDISVIKQCSPWIGVCLLFAITGCGDESFANVVQTQTNASVITQGTTIGQPHFPDGDTADGGEGQSVNGIQASAVEKLIYHVHAHLSLFVNGKQIAIPEGIGILPPRGIQDGFVNDGSGFYWLHTHDATGIIHIESPTARTYTLGDFFDIWGQPLSNENVAGFQGSVHVSVDGTVFTGNPRTVPLNAHTEVTLEIGSPLVTPPVYIFPDGL